MTSKTLQTTTVMQSKIQNENYLDEDNDDINDKDDDGYEDEDEDDGASDAEDQENEKDNADF